MMIWNLSKRRIWVFSLGFGEPRANVWAMLWISFLGLLRSFLFFLRFWFHLNNVLALLGLENDRVTNHSTTFFTNCCDK